MEKIRTIIIKNPSEKLKGFASKLRLRQKETIDKLQKEYNEGKYNEQFSKISAN